MKVITFVYEIFTVKFVNDALSEHCSVAYFASGLRWSLAGRFNWSPFRLEFNPHFSLRIPVHKVSLKGFPDAQTIQTNSFSYRSFVSLIMYGAQRAGDQIEYTWFILRIVPNFFRDHSMCLPQSTVCWLIHFRNVNATNCPTAIRRLTFGMELLHWNYFRALSNFGNRKVGLISGPP